MSQPPTSPCLRRRRRRRRHVPHTPATAHHVRPCVYIHHASAYGQRSVVRDASRDWALLESNPADEYFGMFTDDPFTERNELVRAKAADCKGHPQPQVTVIVAAQLSQHCHSTGTALAQHWHSTGTAQHSRPTVNVPTRR